MGRMGPISCDRSDGFDRIDHDRSSGSDGIDFDDASKSLGAEPFGSSSMGQLRLGAQSVTIRGQNCVTASLKAASLRHSVTQSQGSLRHSVPTSLRPEGASLSHPKTRVPVDPFGPRRNQTRAGSLKII